MKTERRRQRRGKDRRVEDVGCKQYGTNSAETGALQLSTLGVHIGWGGSSKEGYI